MKIVSEYWDKGLECASSEQLLDIRTLKIQKHTRYAYQNSQFYKKAFDKAGVMPDEIKTLEDFRQQVPFLTHEQLIENQKSNPPFGDFLTTGVADIRRIYCSPGPLIMPFSKNDMDAYINATANGLYISGARRGDIVDITYGYQWDLAGTMLDDGFRRIGCAVIPGGTGMTKTHIYIMKHLGVNVVFAFPSFAMKIVETAEEIGIDPRNDLQVRLIIIGGEVYHEDEKQVLAKKFGAEVREMYGGAETGFIGSECAYGGGMHIYTDSIVEVIDSKTGEIVSDGGPGEIVVTDFSRKGMPIIRYRTNDIVEGINSDPCPCGRTSLRMGRIVGRTGDILRVKGVYLIPARIAEVIELYKELGRFQVIVDRTRIRETLTIKVESSDIERDQNIKRRLADDLRAVTRLNAIINLVPFDSIKEEVPQIIDNRF